MNRRVFGNVATVIMFAWICLTASRNMSVLRLALETTPVQDETRVENAFGCRDRMCKIREDSLWMTLLQEDLDAGRSGLLEIEWGCSRRSVLDIASLCVFICGFALSAVGKQRFWRTRMLLFGTSLACTILFCQVDISGSLPPEIHIPHSTIYAHMSTKLVSDIKTQIWISTVVRRSALLTVFVNASAVVSVALFALWRFLTRKAAT